jgi:hypothetical protein
MTALTHTSPRVGLEWVGERTKSPPTPRTISHRLFSVNCSFTQNDTSCAPTSSSDELGFGTARQKMGLGCPHRTRDNAQASAAFV